MQLFDADYVIYACIIIIMTTTAVLFSSIETLNSQKAVQKLAASATRVNRLLIKRLASKETFDSRWEIQRVTISSTQLLPGDLVRAHCCAFPHGEQKALFRYLQLLLCEAGHASARPFRCRH